MKLDGRRESQNVDDRRSVGGGTIAGVGLGGIILAGLIAYMTGGNPLEAISQKMQEGMVTTQTEGNREFTEEEQAMATFSKQILASTEDVWTQVFKEQYNAVYEPPKMVLFTGSVNTACGGATSQVGPFYCSGDQSLYIDLSFFTTMKQQLGADGDFAYAYVIAHEVGHHVENQLGVLGKFHNAMNRTSKAKANALSVKIELLADYLAGVWGHYENENYQSLEDGDLQEAIRCAEVIGDDYLQKKAQGYSVPESFTHGTSAQREKFLKQGLITGDVSANAINAVLNAAN